MGPGGGLLPLGIFGRKGLLVLSPSADASPGPRLFRALLSHDDLHTLGDAAAADLGHRSVRHPDRNFQRPHKPALA